MHTQRAWRDLLSIDDGRQSDCDGTNIILRRTHVVSERCPTVIVLRQINGHSCLLLLRSMIDYIIYCILSMESSEIPVACNLEHEQYKFLRKILCTGFREGFALVDGSHCLSLFRH